MVWLVPVESLKPEPVKACRMLKVRAGDCAAEAATLARLGRHTRLVKYIGQCSPAPGGGTSQLLVTEFAPHGGLDAALERLEDQGRPLPLGHQLTILRQVCTGMHELTAEQVMMALLGNPDPTTSCVALVQMLRMLSYYSASCSWSTGTSPSATCSSSRSTRPPRPPKSR